jgi:hypothetical protein
MSDNDGKNSNRNEIIFDPVKFGVAWFVRAVYPRNQVVERIAGFASEAAAKEWIASDDAKAWVRSRGTLTTKPSLRPSLAPLPNSYLVVASARPNQDNCHANQKLSAQGLNKAARQKVTMLDLKVTTLGLRMIQNGAG